jgi:hypothetical protein
LITTHQRTDNQNIQRAQKNWTPQQSINQSRSRQLN